MAGVPDLHIVVFESDSVIKVWFVHVWFSCECYSWFTEVGDSVGVCCVLYLFCIVQVWPGYIACDVSWVMAALYSKLNPAVELFSRVECEVLKYFFVYVGFHLFCCLSVWVEIVHGDHYSVVHLDPVPC